MSDQQISDEYEKFMGRHTESNLSSEQAQKTRFYLVVLGAITLIVISAIALHFHNMSSVGDREPSVPPFNAEQSKAQDYVDVVVKNSNERESGPETPEVRDFGFDFFKEGIFEEADILFVRTLSSRLGTSSRSPIKNGLHVHFKGATEHGWSQFIELLDKHSPNIHIQTLRIVSQTAITDQHLALIPETTFVEHLQFEGSSVTYAGAVSILGRRGTRIDRATETVEASK